MPYKGALKIGKCQSDREIKEATGCSTLYLSSPRLLSSRRCGMWVSRTARMLHTAESYDMTRRGFSPVGRKGGVFLSAAADLYPASLGFFKKKVAQF